MRSALNLDNWGDGKLPEAVADAIETVRDHLHRHGGDERARSISIALTVKPAGEGMPGGMVLTGYVVKTATPKTKPVVGVAFDTDQGLVADETTEPTGQMKLPENVKPIKKEEGRG